jgi:hypothetical protein
MNSKKRKENLEDLNGRAEMNLVEFPVTTINQSDKRVVLEYEGWVTEKDGNRLRQKWTVRSAGGLGLPNEKGDEILIVLVTKTMEQHVPRKLSFSIYRILQTMGLPINQVNYLRVEELLQQLAGETIYTEKAFWDNEKKQWATIKEAFHIFDKLWIRKREEDGTLSQEQSYIVWGEPFWKSMKTGYVKPVDLNFYFSLERPISKKLYSFLDKQLWYRSSFEIDVFTIAAKLGMAVYKYPSKVIEKLQPAIDELIKKRFLVSADVFKVGKYTRMRFVKGTVQKLLEQGSTEEEAPALSQNTPTTQGIEPKKTWKDRWQEDVQQYDISPEYKELWLQILTTFESQIPSFLTFIVPTYLLSIEGDIATVLVGNAYAKDWLQNRFLKKFKDELNLSLRAAKRQPVKTVKIIFPNQASN